MPLIYQEHIAHGGVFGIWEVTEGDDFFEDRIPLFSKEKEELSILKARKKTEWLSSRYLLHILSEREIRGACLKDEYGKPYLENSEYHISISHSGKYTAVIGTPAICGIDIQVWVPKIYRIAERFIGVEELRNIPDDLKLEYYHTLWGAKESMYKCWGKKGLFFRENMHVHPFKYEENGFFFKGNISKNIFFGDYTLFCRRFDQLILVYALQEN